MTMGFLPATRHTAVRFTLFAGIHVDPANVTAAVGLRPSAVLEDTMAKDNGATGVREDHSRMSKTVPQGSLPTRR